MPSNEGHIHWNSIAVRIEVNYADQDLELIRGRTEDPQGSVRIRAAGDGTMGLHIPTEGWEAIPGTSPVLEARADAIDPIGYLRIRVA